MAAKEAHAPQRQCHQSRAWQRQCRQLTQGKQALIICLEGLRLPGGPVLILGMVWMIRCFQHLELQAVLCSCPCTALINVKQMAAVPTSLACLGRSQSLIVGS